MKQDYTQIKALEIDDQVYISGQLYEQDIRLVAGQGVKTIMNNRPDGEAMGQPLSAELAKIAEELGMTYVYLPVDGRTITEQDVRDFSRVYDELERPLLIFCRTGARSANLWQLADSS